MTNEIVTNALPVIEAVREHLTPQAAAYTFKEWFGVISSILTAIYTMASLAYVHIKHAGGYRQIIADVSGQWPDGFVPPFKGWLSWIKTAKIETEIKPAATAAQPKE